MQELTKAIKEASEPGEIDWGKRLNEAGQDWAKFCLKSLRKPLRNRGLKISTAIADFVEKLEEIEGEDPAYDLDLKNLQIHK